MNAEFIKKLLIPQETKKLYPVTNYVQKIVSEKREELKNIFSGNSKKILLIIGPCSADREDAVLEYFSRLKKIQESVYDKILIVPRLFTSKPRTLTQDYKGLLHNPDPNKSEDLFNGICAMRSLFIKATEQTGFIFADEMVYPENYRYIDDILGYVVVGARSVENQFHRLVSSAIEVPVGFKNPINGNLDIMLNAISSAQKEYRFIYRGWEVHSFGNKYSHAILRGERSKDSIDIPNYDFESLQSLCSKYKDLNIDNNGFIIDTNHSNSSKDPFKQKSIILDVLNSCKKSILINSYFRGFMVESYLEDGRQEIGENCFGKSITDPCLGWEKTKELILDTIYNNL